MNQRIRWGVISTARIGAKAVIPAIQKSNNGIVAAVGSRDLEKGRTFANHCNIPKVYGSYEDLIADPEIDAIYNPLPNGLHGEWSIKAAEGGKHVLCEKPLASDAAEAEKMMRAFNSRGLLLAEAFMYRFHPQIQAAKTLIDEGSIGKIHLIKASFGFPIKSEDDVRLSSALAGGGLMDVGCYCVNISRYMTGEEPLEARAFAEFGADSGVDERLAGMLVFPGGAFAQIDCSFRTYYQQFCEIRGSHGRIVLEYPFRADLVKEIVVHLWVNHEGKDDYRQIAVENPNPYTLMAEDFADAILSNRPPRFSPDDSIAQMRAIDMLYAAARE
ncbi:MAG: Gfo/Idh/MocA family oxidoreductase [Anaerolineae bacterium]|nr:Gfo/Idh/MocA family oxidoreductase [Anaerolineae bacterium]